MLPRSNNSVDGVDQNEVAAEAIVEQFAAPDRGCDPRFARHHGVAGGPGT
jgi:hypothetical protein